MKVRYSYLAEQFSSPDVILNEIKEMVKSGDFTLGKQVDEFEKKFAKLIGTKYAIGVGSGTDALKLPLKALGVGPGDEVITAANTFIATAGAICELGAKPVFVDVTPNYVINSHLIEKAISAKTKAIMPVHLTGEPAEMDHIMNISAQWKIPLVEDACQAILAKYKDKSCGTFGVAAGFSLHPLKNLNVWGDGGVVVTNDEKMNEKLRLLRNHGMVTRDEIGCMGCNSRLDTLQAIVGLNLIAQTEDVTKKRRANADYYDTGLSKISQVALAPRRDYAKSCFHLYMFEVASDLRDRLVDFLQKNEIEAKVHYPIPLYQQRGLADLGYLPGAFPKTDMQSKRIISLPVDQYLTKEMQDFVLFKISTFFASEKLW